MGGAGGTHLEAHAGVSLSWRRGAGGVDEAPRHTPLWERRKWYLPTACPLGGSDRPTGINGPTLGGRHLCEKGKREPRAAVAEASDASGYREGQVLSGTPGAVGNANRGCRQQEEQEAGRGQEGIRSAGRLPRLGTSGGTAHRRQCPGAAGP